jgi:short-subunit dehydrogenase
MADISEIFLKVAIHLFANENASSPKIHIFIHNAAVSTFGTIDTQTLQDIDNSLHVNGLFSLPMVPMFTLLKLAGIQSAGLS